MATKKKVTPKTEVEKPVPAKAKAVRSVKAAPAKAILVPTFGNIKELRQWVKEQKQAKQSYDVAAVQVQLQKFLKV